MRYKYFSALFSTAALAGSLTLFAAPQADDPSSQSSVTTTNTVTTTNIDQTTVPSRPAMSDRHMRREIHKTIARDPTMSMRAERVHIICREGQVTLRGSVPTQMEKDKIVDDAIAVAGSGNVIDQIRVTHPHHLG